MAVNTFATNNYFYKRHVDKLQVSISYIASYTNEIIISVLEIKDGVKDTKRTISNVREKSEENYKELDKNLQTTFEITS